MNEQQWSIGRREIGGYVVWVTMNGMSISRAVDGEPSTDVQFTAEQTLEILRLIEYRRDSLERDTGR